MKISMDIHTHTIVSGHAYSTIRENARMAASHGLDTLAITEHAPQMPYSCGLYYFQNYPAVPRQMERVRLLMGAELNIMDDRGTVDLGEEELGKLDIAIASMHHPCYGESKGIVANTDAYIKVMEQPWVTVIGHPDDGRFPVDFKALVEAAKACHVLLEVNNSSLKPGGFRKDTRENDRRMLEWCGSQNVPIVLGSDAHVDEAVGVFDLALSLLQEMAFPEQLVVKNYGELQPFLRDTV